MNKKVYAIWDNKAEDIAGPALMLHKADAVAIRDFQDIVAGERNKINQHPEDYDLVQLGELAVNEKGEPEIINTEPRMIVSAATILTALQSAEEARQK